MKQIGYYLVGMSALLMGSLSASGQEEANIQSKERPFGLEVVGPVMEAGSDSSAATFQKEALPEISKLLDQTLSESVSVSNQAALSLDPTKLTMATASTARVYFVGEGAGYRNTLGFNTLLDTETTPLEVVTDSAQLIFPDASSSIDSLGNGRLEVRTAKTPLLAGDFVDLGKFEAGTVLDFFLIAAGATGGSNTYAAPSTRNPDKLDHVVAFALPDSPYLVIGFEDMYGGGDMDYNDVVFAVDIGKINVQHLVSTPEPAMAATFLVLLGLWFGRRHRQVGTLRAA